jgi:hypothetical protein
VSDTFGDTSPSRPRARDHWFDRRSCARAARDGSIQVVLRQARERVRKRPAGQPAAGRGELCGLEQRGDHRLGAGLPLPASA